jgi:hypothetical protein
MAWERVSRRWQLARRRISERRWWISRRRTPGRTTRRTEYPSRTAATGS